MEYQEYLENSNLLVNKYKEIRGYLWPWKSGDWINKSCQRVREEWFLVR